jgi:hypothetical protein
MKTKKKQKKKGWKQESQGQNSEWERGSKKDKGGKW